MLSTQLVTCLSLALHLPFFLSARGKSIAATTKVQMLTNRNQTPPPTNANKAVWYATELFGKAAAVWGETQQTPQTDAPETPPPNSLDEAILRLKRDYHGTENDPRPYFLTGTMDESLYDAMCEFSDPFTSFKGRDRFVSNLRNLAGGFICDAEVRQLGDAVLDSQQHSEPTYTTRLLVKLQLALPWKPVLAWVWCVIPFLFSNFPTYFLLTVIL